MDVLGLSGRDSGSCYGKGSFKINKEFATKYEKAKQKQELDALKQKYGDSYLADDAENSSTSESEDEDAEALTPKIELQFLKTLSMLQKKDPEIYKKEVKFFEEEDTSTEDEERENPKGKESKQAMTIKDYERMRLLEKGSKAFVSDSEEESGEEETKSKTYVDEQEELKKSFSKAVDAFEADDQDDLLQKREKTKEEKVKEEREYQDWLNKRDRTNLKSGRGDTDALNRYWRDTGLNEDDKFLRDYILGRKYIDKDSTEIPHYDEIVQDGDSEEEDGNLEKQEEFERKFNFRYEEPDEELIKSYPRTIKGSVRRQDDKRAKKRKERESRKKEEKEKKQQELKQLKNLKRKEIMEKIERLKEITGNASVGFLEEDVDGDFDPKKYDALMQKVFSEDYYEEEEKVKPEFSEDEEDALNEEQWDSWNGGFAEGNYNWESTGSHCEDPDFNMDAEYDPNADEEKMSKRQRKKSKLAKALMQKKPLFNPEEKSFEEYFDEYYKLDYEDIIGDMPVRFKYREVVPNSFGLSTEEILTCEDAELNKWCSLKRTLRYSTKKEERVDRQKFNRKGRDHASKLQILTSLQETAKESRRTSIPQQQKKQRHGKLLLANKSLSRTNKVRQRFELGKARAGRVDKLAKRAKYDILRKLKDGDKKRTAKIPADRLAAYGLNKKKRKK